MKRLTLMRHAQADNPLTDQQDWHRPLTKRGLLDAKAMARRLKVLGWRPDLILSSPAIRTRQTTEALAKCFPSAAREFNEDLYLASPKQMLAVIREHGGMTPHLLLVAHNPGISELADLLANDRRIEGMPTAAIVSAEFTIDAWQALLPASGMNVEFDYPQRSA